MMPGEAPTDPRQEPCPNCGDATVGNYCPACGQRKTLRRLSLRHVLKDAIDDQLSFNSSLSRTMKTLMFRPGVITTEYLAGRIASYIPPFRLYLVTSFLMFLVIGMFGGRGGAIVKLDNDNIRTDSAAVAQRDSIRRERQADGDTTEMNLPLGDGALEARARAKLERVKKMDRDEMNRMFEREFWNRMPVVLILLVPAFAGIIALLYWRHHRVYVEHFIFALHVHAFGFIVLSAMILTNRWVAMVLAAWVAVYLLLALRRVYNQGWIKSTLKLSVLVVTYLIMLLPALMAGIAIAVAFMPV
jgi:hypothetical protein